MDYREEARTGEAMANLMQSEDFREFRNKVLKPIEENAFKIFTSSPADDQIAIIGAQQMKKVVDHINQEMISLVEQGRLALDNIKNSNPE